MLRCFCELVMELDGLGLLAQLKNREGLGGCDEVRWAFAQLNNQTEEAILCLLRADAHRGPAAAFEGKICTLTSDRTVLEIHAAI